MLTYMTIYEDYFLKHVVHMLNPYNQNNIDIQMKLNLFQHINLDYHRDSLGKYLIDEHKK